MENNIILKIGTVFNGEGMQKLQGAVKESNRHIQKTISVSSGLANSFASLDTTASRVASSCTSLFQAFAQGGLSGAAFAAVAMVINSRLREMQEELEKAKKDASELESAINKSFSENLAKRIADSIAYAKSLGTEFERIEKHARALEAAFNGLQSAKSSGGIITLQTEKLNATIGEMDESLRQSIAAAYDVKIAQAKLAKATEDAANAENAARFEKNENDRRIANLNEQIAEIDSEIAIQKKNAAAITEADFKKAREIAAKIDDLEKARAEIITKRKDAIANGEVLEVKLNTTIQNNENKLADQTNAVTEAAESERALNQKLRERAEAEEAAKLEKEQEKLVQQDYNDAVKSRADNMSALAQAENELKNAEERLKTAIDNYNANITNNSINAAINGTNNGKGVANPRAGINANWNNIQEATAKEAVKQGIKDGTIRTVDAYEKAEKSAKRSARDAMSSEETNRMASEKFTADRIRAKSEKARSKSEQAWLDKYDEVKRGRNADQDAIDQAEMDVQAARENITRSLTAIEGYTKKISDIDEKMHALGLK